MTKRCLDEGILQAFIDGELSREQAAGAAAHLSVCGACAAALSAAEQESAFFAASFAPDEALNVPTEVLRSRIGAAVAQLETGAETREVRREGGSLGGFLASLKGFFSFTPQGAAAFAGLLAVVTLSVIYFAVQRSQPQTRTPGGLQAAPEMARVAETPAPPAVVTQPRETAEAEPAQTPAKGRAGQTAARANVVARRAATSGRGARPWGATPSPKEEALPGEAEYRTAIASLEKTIKLGGDESLRPSLRVEYERNLALLDSAISQTRQIAAQNPKDKDAMSFLLSAYQSKVELLTKVADQAQVAALGR